MNKDYTGNNKSIFTCNGCSNHSIMDREQRDFYATEPKATQLLLENEFFSNDIWEPACGTLHMSNVISEYGYNVKSSDIIDRTDGKIEIIDFLNFVGVWNGDIITNPPYKFAKEFVEKALSVVNTGNKVAMFLKLTFLESKSRKLLFDKTPFKKLYVSSSRLQCAKNGEFEKFKNGTGTAVAYGWYVWEKGFKGDPVIKWIN